MPLNHSRISEEHLEHPKRAKRAVSLQASSRPSLNVVLILIINNFHLFVDFFSCFLFSLLHFFPLSLSLSLLLALSFIIIIIIINFFFFLFFFLLYFSSLDQVCHLTVIARLDVVDVDGLWGGIDRQ